MHQVTIRQDLCTGDGLCVRQCFRKCLELDASGKAIWTAQAPSLCVGCGHCTAICPHSAITLDGVSPDSLRPAYFHIEENNLFTLLSSRRSIRIYKKTPIPRPLIQKAIEMSCYAPTGTNRRNVGYIIVDSSQCLDELRLVLAAWMKDFPKWQEHYRRFLQGEDTIFRGAVALVAIHAPSPGEDNSRQTVSLSPQAAAGAASYLELALHGMGLGSCWCGLLIRGAEDKEEIRQILRLPEGNSVYAALLLGYPAVHFPRIPMRVPAVVQWI